jgi:hypothetical protein
MGFGSLIEPHEGIHPGLASQGPAAAGDLQSSKAEHIFIFAVSSLAPSAAYTGIA